MFLFLFLYGYVITIIVGEQTFCSSDKFHSVAAAIAPSTSTVARLPLKYASRENNDIYSAIIQNDDETFDMIFLFGFHNALRFKNARKETLYHTAIAHHRPKMLEKLHRRKVIDVNAQAYDGQTAVHYAVFHDDSKSLELLRHAGANLEIKDHDGMTPFSLAVRLGRDGIISQLLSIGVDINATNRHGHQPLHFAKTPVVAQELLGRGADVHAKGIFGHTPVIFAIKNNHSDVAECLIKSSAQIDYKDESQAKIINALDDFSPMKVMLIDMKQYPEKRTINSRKRTLDDINA